VPPAPSLTRPTVIGWAQLYDKVGLTPLPLTAPRPPSQQIAWPSPGRPSFDLDTLDQLLDECVNVSPQTAGTLVVTRLTDTLDLTGAMLLTRPSERWVHTHPHTTRTSEVQTAVSRRAQALFAAPPEDDTCVVAAAGRMIRLLPLWRDRRVHAVLCLGPKRSGRPYKQHEEIMLRILVRALALLFAAIDLGEVPDVRPASQATGADEIQLPAGRPLSACEIVVLGYLAQGLSNKEIGACVGRSRKTIGIHVEHIYEKLNVHNRTQAIHAARQRRLLPADGNA